MSQTPGRIKPSLRERFGVAPAAPESHKKPGRLAQGMQELAGATLLIAPLLTDAATVQGIAFGNKSGENGLAESFASAAALVEKFHGLRTDELVEQAMFSVDAAAREIAGGTLKRGPITPAIHLFAAEKVIAVRSLRTKEDFLKKLFDKCGGLVHEYDGQKDVQGMIMARMLYEATEGIVADALTNDKELAKAKSEHTEDRAIQALNGVVQKNPGDLIAALGIYVSTPNGTVFGIPKNDNQIDIAQNLLFANRGIVSQQLMLLEESNPGKQITSLVAGSEFLEGDNREAMESWRLLAEGKLAQSPEKAAHAARQLEWHRTNWFSVVNSMSPALFAEMMMIADVGRGDNRLFLKPAKYNPGRDNIVTSDMTPLEAFALTNHYEPVYDRMPAIRMTPNTPKGKHGLSSPRVITKLVADGLFPSGKMRKQMGDRTKWVDKFGPFNQDYSIGTVPTMCSLDELKKIRETAIARFQKRGLPDASVRVISVEKLEMVAEANDHFNKLFLDATLSEVMGTATEQNALFADFAATQLFFVGRALQFMPHTERATQMYGRLNDFLVSIMAVPGAASTQVREASRLVLEGCLPYYPQDARDDFLKKFTKMCVENPALLKQWKEVTLPMAHRAQSFLPELGEEGKMSGVRPGIAKDILSLTHQMFNASPDLEDKPGSLIEMLLGSNLSGTEFSFALDALQMTWFLGNRLHFTPGQEFIVGKDGKRLAELNTEVQQITADAKKRLAYEFARRLRIEAPMESILGFGRIINVVERLSGDQRGVQERLLSGMAAMSGIFEEDLLVTSEDGGVRLLTLPKKIPGMEEGGMFHIATDADAQKLIEGMRAIAGTDEGGVVSEIVGQAETRLKSAPDLAEKIIEGSFGRGALRESLILQEVGNVLGAILGVPQDGGKAGKASASVSRNMAPFIRNLWGPYTGGYGRSIGLVGLLAARDQSLGRGAEGISEIVDALMRAEQNEAQLSMTISRDTGSTDAIKSSNELARGMNAILLQRLGDAKQMMGVTDGFRTEALRRTAEQLNKIQTLEGRLVSLHGKAHEEELRIAEDKLRMRKMQIDAAVAFVDEQFPALLRQIYEERRQVVTQLTQLSSKIQASRMEVIAWLINSIDPHGNQTQLRLKLQEKLREYTGTDDWMIEAPSLADLLAYTGLKMEEADINSLSGVSEASKAIIRKNGGKKTPKPEASKN